jgi:DNA-directed RNA polymerase subunit RPC12/RpoP
MSTKIIRMNDEESDGYIGEESDVYIGENSTYIYPTSDLDEEYVDGNSEQDHEQEDYPEFYTNLEIVQEQKPITSKTSKTVKNKPRSMSIDSVDSEITKRPNFKCGSCKKSFLLDKNQKMIRCSFCGYRILFKLRTHSYITYKTE